MTRIGVLGAGSWGTTLADLLARERHEVRIWAWESAVVEQINREHVNGLFLDGCMLVPELVALDDPAAAVRDAELVVSAAPSHAVRQVLGRAADAIGDGTPLVSATKGLETDTLQRMSEVAAAVVPAARFVALSGPSFAAEVYAGQPTAVVAASTDSDAAEIVQQVFSTARFRVYAGTDVVGVELGGGLKNVMAIAAGILEGLGLGHNPRAALITRGLAEISRLACAVGGRRDTLAGLSGLGDLVLTCTGDLSRNRRVGIELGRGRPLPDVLSGIRMVAEGVRTTGAALALGERHGIELPIAAQMAAVLEGRSSPIVAVESLMGRRQRPEADR